MRRAELGSEFIAIAGGKVGLELPPLDVRQQILRDRGDIARFRQHDARMRGQEPAPQRSDGSGKRGATPCSAIVRGRYFKGIHTVEKVT